MKNPFDESTVAKSYEGWFETAPGRMIDREETALIHSMIPEGNGKRLLDVGCGTGHFSRVMAKYGYEVYGLDMSIAMLREAKKRNIADYYRGDAHKLPHPDRSFYATSAFTLLEFIDNPQQALEEMIRVSQELVLVAFLNKWGGINVRRITRNILGKRDVYSSAHFFGVGEMKRIVRKAAKSEKRLSKIQWGSAVGSAVLKRFFSKSRFDSFILFTIHLV
jgi:ubiquinone/menaquinone biosynthesis C-methylase UbiE